MAAHFSASVRSGDGCYDAPGGFRDPESIPDQTDLTESISHPLPASTGGAHGSSLLDGEALSCARLERETGIATKKIEKKQVLR